MKKTIMILFVWSLFVGIANTPVMAGEVDILIKKLVEKEILTPSDAEALLKEMQKEGEREKGNIREVAAETSKEEVREFKEEVQQVKAQRQEEMVKEIQDKQPAVPKGLKGVSVEMLSYLDYSNGEIPESNDGTSDLNQFKITRGYVTIKKEIRPWFHARVTMDTHQDDVEDWKVRLKYTYAELRPPDFGFLTDMKSEIGIGHMPLLDFEEHMNPYRMQGTMAIERAGTLNSADIGVSLRGYFGGKLEDAEERTGSHHYDGKYGSWHLGIYNGPGYHASENNSNKPFEARLTLRPLSEVIPGLQLTYFGILAGKGNEGNNPAGVFPDYEVNMGMLSYENPRLTLIGEYFTTEGNKSGTWVDAQGRALKTKGYSLFGNLKLPILDNKISLFGRYDHFDQDDNGMIAIDADYDMVIGGLAYDFYKGNTFMLAYETTDYGPNAGKKGKLPVPDNHLGDEKKLQAVFQIKF
ncbi:MAG: hypothetical protein JW896_14870 [Deltaproteobacteria bacterium]|nr:hypothetical protein [Deltaproteobacteria bacterium]